MLGQQLLDDHLEVRVDREVTALAGDVAGEDLDVPGLVHHLHGGGELAVEVGHGVHQLAAGHQGGLLAVQDLGEQEELGGLEEPVALVLRELLHAAQAGEEVGAPVEDVDVRLEALPVDVELGVPLVALRLAVERLELLGLERVVVAELAPDQGVGGELREVHRSSGGRRRAGYRAHAPRVNSARRPGAPASREGGARWLRAWPAAR